MTLIPGGNEKNLSLTHIASIDGIHQEFLEDVYSKDHHWQKVGCHEETVNVAEKGTDWDYGSPEEENSLGKPK